MSDEEVEQEKVEVFEQAPAIEEVEPEVEVVEKKKKARKPLSERSANKARKAKAKADAETLAKEVAAKAPPPPPVVVPPRQPTGRELSRRMRGL